jgi:hypothetical protein
VSGIRSDKVALIGGAIFSAVLSVSIYFEFMWLAFLPVVCVLGWWAVKRMDARTVPSYRTHAFRIAFVIPSEELQGLAC